MRSAQQEQPDEHGEHDDEQHNDDVQDRLQALSMRRVAPAEHQPDPPESQADAQECQALVQIVIPDVVEAERVHQRSSVEEQADGALPLEDEPMVVSH